MTGGDKALTTTDKKVSCSKTVMSQAQLKECQNEHESGMFVDILSAKFYRIPVLSEIKLGK